MVRGSGDSGPQRFLGVRARRLVAGMELSRLSQQVRVLRRAGAAHSRRVGNAVICSLRDPQTARLLTVARRC